LICVSGQKHCRRLKIIRDILTVLLRSLAKREKTSVASLDFARTKE
jgi:hypothetical protein